jgi:hypothetical protein
MSILRLRSRDLSTPFNQVLGKTFYRNKRNAYEMPGTPQSVFFAPGVVERSFDINNGKPPYNVGGPFFLVKVTEPTGVAADGTIFPYQAISEPAGYPLKGQPGDLWQVGYTGSFIHTGLPDLVSIGNKDISSPTDYRSTINKNDLSNLGGRAYGRLRPKVEVAGLGQAVAEADDVTRMLKTTSKGFHDIWKTMGGSGSGTFMQPKRLADQFINVQFGWKPFVKDVSDMYNLITNYESHLDKAERLNDKWLKRRFAEDEILDQSKVYDENRNSSSPLFRTYLAPALGSGTCQNVRLQVMRQKMVRIWYEGSFKYYRPEFDKRIPMHENIRAGSQFLTLAGANINPTLIYKVTPWTWCLDWVTHTGDNIQLLQDMATNAVVSKYMYLMREEYDRYEYTSVHTYPNTVITGVSYQEVRVKRRVSAECPFGFSMPPGGLSGMQLGILGALGLSKWG